MKKHEATLFLAGDVMIGRGIDQALPYPIVDDSATPTSHAGAFSSIWGDALDELTRRNPDVRIANLETSITTSDDCWPNKRFRFRMHPANTPCLTEAGFDCCVLANNHVMDFGYKGLLETMESLRQHGLRFTGAGADLNAASAPTYLDLGGRGRVLVFALAHPSSYTPRKWAAGSGAEHPGVNLLGDYTPEHLHRIKAQIEQTRRPDDIVVLSIHWGVNWGYEIGFRQRYFAHKLIDTAGVDVVHGHSSHHPMSVEIYRGRPILYGCGDLINDYQHTGENAPYRPDLAPMYFLRVDISTGRLNGITLVPMQIHALSLRHASRTDAQWLKDTLNRGGFTVSLASKIARSRRLKRTRFRHRWQLAADDTLTISL